MAAGSTCGSIRTPGLSRSGVSNPRAACRAKRYRKRHMRPIRPSPAAASPTHSRNRCEMKRDDPSDNALQATIADPTVEEPVVEHRPARRRKTSTLSDDPLWYKDAIIYQVHIKSFFDANNDGIGDFPGLLAKLD